MSQHTADDVTAGKGRKDEVGHTGIYPATGPLPEGDAEVVTPGEINSGIHRHGPVGHSEKLKNAERMPRMGNEDDKPANDRLGD